MRAFGQPSSFFKTNRFKKDIIYETDLMTMVSAVFTPVVVKFSPTIQEWLHIATIDFFLK